MGRIEVLEWKLKVTTSFLYSINKQIIAMGREIEQVLLYHTVDNQKCSFESFFSTFSAWSITKCMHNP